MTDPGTPAEPQTAADGQPDLPGAGPRAWHTLPVEEAAKSLQADTQRGLTDAEAARRRKRLAVQRYG
jgi:hypothetical protein